MFVGGICGQRLMIEEQAMTDFTVLLIGAPWRPHQGETIGLHGRTPGGKLRRPEWINCQQHQAFANATTRYQHPFYILNRGM